MTPPNQSKKNRPSKILLEELFASEDDRFLELFHQFDSYELLKHFTTNWLADTRPWAQQQLIQYLHGPLNHPGHEVVVKRILKTALEKNDLDLLIHLAVVADGLVRRKRVTSYRYDYQTNQYDENEYLLAEPNKTVKEVTGRFETYTYGKETYQYRLPDIVNRPGNRLFSQKTRAFMRRQLWRTFRRMAYKDPETYADSICKALALYDDSYFPSGEAILDNWSLMHACYFHAKEITFTAYHTNLATGASLSTLSPAPYQPHVWQTQKAAERLWLLLDQASSQFVRLWTIDMLRIHHKQWLGKIQIHQLLLLLANKDATVAGFAAELFRQLDSLSRVEVATWLQLLEDADFSVLPTICDAMRQHLSPDRLTEQQLIDLTTATPAAVATMGFKWLKERHNDRPLPPSLLTQLSQSKCQWEAESIAAWAIDQIASHPPAPSSQTSPGSDTVDFLTEFFDSQSDPVRQAACKWLKTNQEKQEAALWVKLSETPYDHVRFALVDVLRKVLNDSPKKYFHSLSVDQQLRILTAVVLCVDRGSRSKPKAIEQLTSIAISSPENAKAVVAVLAVAGRSSRGPERAAGLSALTILADESSDLQEVVSEHLSEWDWSFDAIENRGQQGVQA